MKSFVRFAFLLILTLTLAFLLPASRLDSEFCVPVRQAVYTALSVVPYSFFEIFLLFLPLLLLVSIKLAFLVFNRKTVAGILIIVSFSYLINIAIPSRKSDDAYFCTETSQDTLLCASEELILDINLLGNREDFVFSELPFGAKRTIFPRLYTALGISGLYYFPTAEYVVNTDAPDYVCAFTAAHEYAHFNSVMREDEANLFAFKLLSESEDLFFRYSAALYAYEIIASELKKENPEAYQSLSGRISDCAGEDLTLHSEYAEKYKNGVFYKHSVKLNDMMQKIYDKRGKESYSSSAYLLADYIVSR